MPQYQFHKTVTSLRQIEILQSNIKFSDRDGFVQRYPPTGEQVMLKYYGYHNAKREVSGGISSKGDAIKMVVEDNKR